jgi:hypothetical protein
MENGKWKMDSVPPEPAFCILHFAFFYSLSRFPLNAMDRDGCGKIQYHREIILTPSTLQRIV